MSQQISINTSGSGDKIVWDAQTTDRNGVFDYVLFVGGAATVIVKDEAGTEFGRYTVAAADKVVVDALSGGHRFVAKGDIILNVSAAVTVTGHITIGGI